MIYLFVVANFSIILKGFVTLFQILSNLSDFLIFVTVNWLMLLNHVFVRCGLLTDNFGMNPVYTQRPASIPEDHTPRYPENSHINPSTLRAAKTGLTILLIFSSQNRFYQKYLKEKCLSEYYQQLSFKYFVRICFISKLFSKV